jgi:hypothetical protein
MDYRKVAREVVEEVARGARGGRVSITRRVVKRVVEERVGVEVDRRVLSKIWTYIYEIVEPAVVGVWRSAREVRYILDTAKLRAELAARR